MMGYMKKKIDHVGWIHCEYVGSPQRVDHNTP
uniref:Uncharacterized protein n=1 Tax=Anguilla anguilla TaxID=7936 RepID=A0A0E9VZB6_ANGAN